MALDGQEWQVVIYGGLRVKRDGFGPLTHAAQFAEDGSIRTGSFMTGASGTTLSLGDEFTLAAWVKFNDFFGTNRPIFGVVEAGIGPWNNALLLGQDGTTDDFALRTYDDDDTNNTDLNAHQYDEFWNGGWTPGEDVWGLLAVRYDGSAGTTVLNVNGVDISAGTQSGTPSTLNDANDRTFILGGIDILNAGSSFCKIACFAAWSSTLSAASLLALYNSSTYQTDDWRNALGATAYDATAAAALEHYYRATDATVATFGTDLVGGHDLTTVDGTDGPADANMSADAVTKP